MSSYRCSGSSLIRLVNSSLPPLLDTRSCVELPAAHWSQQEASGKLQMSAKGPGAVWIWRSELSPFPPDDRECAKSDLDQDYSTTRCIMYMDMSDSSFLTLRLGHHIWETPVRCWQLASASIELSPSSSGLQTKPYWNSI